MTRTIEEITEILAGAYDLLKHAERQLKGTTGKDAKPGLKKEFFDEATKAQKDTLAQKSVVIDIDDFTKARERVLKLNPGWVITGDSGHPDGGWQFGLEEDPVYKPYTYVNPSIKKTFTKQVVNGSPYLDDEELREADADLWEQVSVPTRVLRPLEDLTPEQLVQVQEFIYPGKPIIKLAPVRNAKPDELADE